MQGLAWVGSTLYGGSGSTGNLYAIDPGSSLSYIGSGSYGIGALAYDGSTLYGGGGAFFTVNPSNGSQTLIKSGVYIEAMEYYNGTLYGGNGSGQFFTIDTSTGNISNIGPGTYGINGLAVSNGIMYGANSTALFSIDLTTGTQTYIGDTGIGFVGALAGPMAPEPISSILFLTGSAVLAGRGYLKKRGFKKGKVKG
ncbi:MAG: PQQ-like beta-propeller repeat protein [Nitrospirae bacterium]|nr:PQQ-like beta-propeller repeat protein [Nitrospirota bacterium]